MRLINRILINLDKKSPEGSPPDARLLSGASPEVCRRRVPRLLRWGLLLLLLAGASVSGWQCIGSWPPAETIAARAKAVSASIVPEAIAAVRPEPQPMAVPPPTPVRPASDRATESPAATVGQRTAALQNLYFVQVGNQLRVAAVFSHLPEYRLFRSAHEKQIVLELPARIKTVSLPESKKPPMLQKMAYETHGDRIQLVFSFEEACRYDAQMLRKAPEKEGCRLVIVVQPEKPDIRPDIMAGEPATPKPSISSSDTPTEAGPAPAPDAVTRAFTRQAVRPTKRHQAEHFFQNGITAFRKGHFEMAAQALRGALAIESGHLRARDALLRLLDRQGRRDQVKALLAEGLQKMPGHLSYRIRLARLLIEEGRLSRAETVLTRNPLPSANQSPDLHQMLATVYLRKGRYGEAAKTYRTLLAVKPEQAVWWMGLGIALEGNQSMDQARQAYSRALVHENLSEGVQEFIRRRLAASGKAQTMQPSADMRAAERRS